MQEGWLGDGGEAGWGDRVAVASRRSGGLQQGLGEGQGWLQGRTKTGQEVRGYVTGTREGTGGNQPYP